MSSFEVVGGKKLSGTIYPQGAKNEALQIICAVLLSDQKITIKNVPDIIDVNKLIDLLKSLGVLVVKVSKGVFQFQSKNIDLGYLNSEDFELKCKSLRGSIMIVGPLLARYGSASIPRPGGDKIGRRRLDTHFENLIKLGGKFSYDKENKKYKIETKKLKGCKILLDQPSVTGTANIIMASVLAEGETTIYNAACEPYIQQLCSMLSSMGASIKGKGSNLLHIKGVDKLNGCEHTIQPDIIEIGSWIGLAALTRSELTIKNVHVESLEQILSVFSKIGVKTHIDGNDIKIPAHKNGYEIQNNIDGSVLTISDGPWPLFTPDLISIILVVATQAKGSVLIHQKMFESRLFFVDKLIDMGAKIILCDPHRAVVIGHNFKSRLKATKMSSPDIRAGISLLIAALSAKGISTINNIEQNISQFPTAIEFYEDSAYSKIVTNTVSNVDSYFGGYWSLSLDNQLLLREQGIETFVQVQFDTEAIFVALDGFMVWNYEVDGNTIKEVYQKTIETDISIFHEDTSYLTVMSTGSGIIDGFTEIAKEDIAINIDYNRGSYYVFRAVFTPGLDLDSDAITASLDSEEYGHLTVQLPISIRLEDE